MCWWRLASSCSRSFSTEFCPASKPHLIAGGRIAFRLSKRIDRSHGFACGPSRLPDAEEDVLSPDAQIYMTSSALTKLLHALRGTRPVHPLLVWSLLLGGGDIVAAQAPSSVGEPAEVDRRSVAVLRFADPSGSTADDWVGAGIAETLISELERLGTLGVVDATATIDRDPVTVGRRLGAGWVILGTIQRTGDEVQIIARLVDVQSGATRRTVQIEGAQDEIFALQDQLLVELGPTFESVARVAATASLAPALRAAAEPGIVSSPTPPNEGAPAPAAALLAPAVVPPGTQPDIGAAPLAVAEAGLVPGRPTVRPTRAETAPDIDGRLDDAAWRNAATLTEFTQQAPLEGAPATEDTEVYITYDNEHIYFGFYVHYSDPSIMRANRVDRDTASMDDLMTIYIDTFLDQQRAYDFDVNAFNVQGDGIVTSSGNRRGGAIPYADRSWDALFHSATQIVDDGYTAEMAIPFKSLRYPQRGPGVPHQWGFQIVREIKSKNEENAVWAPMSRDVAGFHRQMGLMQGMTDFSTSRNLEFLPTFTAIQFGSLDTSTGGFVNQDTDPQAGLNIKYGVTSNLTADVTFNPDFSQIESDRPQIEINRRFPLFFSELRPFFVEGAEIFDFPGPVTFVHTRTIVDPTWGAKLTGKAGRFAVGVLTAEDEAPGNLEDLTDARFGETAQNFIGRVKYDVYSESHLGAIFTDREFLDSSSKLGGIDGSFRLSQTMSTNFRMIGSQHRDLDGLERTGHVYDVSVRDNGRNLSWFAAAYEISPDFDTEVGFVRRVDQRHIVSNLSYRWWPETWLINWGPRVSYGRNWNFDGVLDDENAGLRLNFDFAKSIRFSASADRDMERFGGLNFFKTEYGVSGGVSSNRALDINVSYDRGDQIFFDIDNPFLGNGSRSRVSATLRPFARFSSRVGVNTSRLVDTRGLQGDVFNVEIYRAQSVLTFTDRLLMRNITEYNTFNKDLDFNILFTYRVNAGTVFYFGYDDHYRQADQLEGDLDGDGFDDRLFFTTDLRRTNRAIFTKLRYLFRY